MLATVKKPEFNFYKNGLYTECNSLSTLDDSFMVSVVKEDSGWVVFTEEHEPSEIAKTYGTLYHKTKKSAMATALEFCEDFYWMCFTEKYINE